MTHLETFKELYELYKLELSINHIPSGNFEGQLVSLDVEHDEEGGFVGCGIYVVGSNCVYYYSDLVLLSRVSFHTLSVIAHNGKTDLELLRQWGIPVQDYQLIHDTQLIAHIIDSSKKAYGLKS